MSNRDETSASTTNNGKAIGKSNNDDKSDDNAADDDIRDRALAIAAVLVSMQQGDVFDDTQKQNWRLYWSGTDLPKVLEFLFKGSKLGTNMPRSFAKQLYCLHHAAFDISMFESLEGIVYKWICRIEFGYKEKYVISDVEKSVAKHKDACTMIWVLQIWRQKDVSDLAKYVTPTPKKDAKPVTCTNKKKTAVKIPPKKKSKLHTGVKTNSVLRNVTWNTPTPDGPLRWDPLEEGKWYDWICIKQSGFKNANLGVYAAREFPKGVCIGFYVATPIWTAAVPWTAQPPPDFADNSHLKATEYSMNLRNPSGTALIGDVQDVDKYGSRPLYMGMHYINDAIHELDGKVADHNKKMTNVMSEEDGQIYSYRTIPAGQELFLSYDQPPNFSCNDDSLS